MNRDNDSRRLLDDILAPGPEEEFKEDLRQRCLRELGRRSSRRRVYERLTVAVCVVAVAGIFRGVLERESPPGETSEGRDADISHFVIRSTPLGQAVTVRTPKDDLMQLDVEIVQTTWPQLGWRVTDEELLGLFDGSPRALVKQGVQTARLIFLDPLDHVRFYGLN